MSEAGPLLERTVKIAHNLNCAYRLFIGEDEVSTWSELSAKEKNFKLATALKILKLKEITPKAVHDAWMEHTLSIGWRYGEEEDVDELTTPNLVPYEELPDAQKLKDVIYANVLKAHVE